MPEDPDRPTITGRQNRGGEIILRRPWERYVFIGGLAAAIVVAAVIIFVWR
jgi:hypothetical protein